MRIVGFSLSWKTSKSWCLMDEVSYYHPNHKKNKVLVEKLKKETR